MTGGIGRRLDQIREQGTTILLATHDPIVRDHVGASRLLYIEHGRLMHDVPAANGREVTGDTGPSDQAQAPAASELPADMEAVA